MKNLPGECQLYFYLFLFSQYSKTKPLYNASQLKSKILTNILSSFDRYCFTMMSSPSPPPKCKQEHFDCHTFFNILWVAGGYWRIFWMWHILKILRIEIFIGGHILEDDIVIRNIKCFHFLDFFRVVLVPKITQPIEMERINLFCFLLLNIE